MIKKHRIPHYAPLSERKYFRHAANELITVMLINLSVINISSRRLISYSLRSFFSKQASCNNDINYIFFPFSISDFNHNQKRKSEKKMKKKSSFSACQTMAGFTCHQKIDNSLIKTSGQSQNHKDSWQAPVAARQGLMSQASLNCCCLIVICGQCVIGACHNLEDVASLPHDLLLIELQNEPPQALA